MFRERHSVFVARMKALPLVVLVACHRAEAHADVLVEGAGGEEVVIEIGAVGGVRIGPAEAQVVLGCAGSGADADGGGRDDCRRGVPLPAP